MAREVPYVRQPYVRDTRSMLDLLRMASAARSSSDAQRAQARATGLVNIGQLIAGALGSMREDREATALAERAAARQQQEDAFKRRDQEIREADVLARIGEREDAATARADAAREKSAADAYKRGGEVAEDVGHGPMSEMQMESVLQGPAAGRARYSFGPGTAEGPELRPTQAQQKAIDTEQSIKGMGGTIGPNGQVVMPPKVDRPAYQDTLEWAAANGDPMARRALDIRNQYRPQPQAPTQRFTPRPITVTENGKTRSVIANYDALTGEYFDPETKQRLTGIGDAPTADMRNKEAAKKPAARAVAAVRELGTDIFKSVGPKQRADAIVRGIDAVFGNDPKFRTYQDSRMALAGTLAVEQQGSRVSDADVRALWLPMVPDAYRDTEESYRLKWELIDAMRGLEAPQGDAPPPAQEPVSGPQPRERRIVNGQLAEWDGKGWKAVRPQ